MIKHTVALVLTLFALAYSLTATAKSPSYNYADISYQKSTGSRFIDFQGPSIAASHLISSNWFIEGAFYDGHNNDGLPEFNLSSFRFDLRRWNFGAGYKNELFSQSNWYTSLNYVEKRSKISNISNNFERSRSIDGWNIKAGIRSNITDRFEVGVQALYETLSGSSPQTQAANIPPEEDNTIVLFNEPDIQNSLKDNRYSLSGYTLFKLSSTLGLKAAIEYGDNRESETSMSPGQSETVSSLKDNNTTYTLGLRWIFS
ncbi:hypothetical protein QSV34_14970 [Porticoccus sp. W117]|uniref:hypothetical protein n=1 Tax=Porticoccus sp. W117 TaxID=3054777 RepID=UPI00259AE998|nr:hypothetical protein [Porticoccus sp. W117]MDM3872654.1 hypothetical protein [Porticoccus sp. W117]